MNLFRPMHYAMEMFIFNAYALPVTSCGCPTSWNIYVPMTRDYMHVQLILSQVSHL